MSILFCTPTYGGQITTPCFSSYWNLKEDLTLAGVEHDFLRGLNESLVTRARSEMCRTFLMDTAYQHLMWIDADIQFESEDVAKLLEMQKDVAVGIYRMKRMDDKHAAWVNGELVTDLEKLPNPCEVEYAGTGFMLIKRGALEKLWEAHPELEYDGPNGTVRHLFGEEIRDRALLSDDYAFCQRWRDLGGKIYADPSVKLTHWGQHGYGE